MSHAEAAKLPINKVNYRRAGSHAHVQTTGARSGYRYMLVIVYADSSREHIPTRTKLQAINRAKLLSFMPRMIAN